MPRPMEPKMADMPARTSAESLHLKLRQVSDVAAAVTPRLEDCLSNYWERSITLRFTGAMLKRLYFLRMDDYYTASFKLGNKPNAASMNVEWSGAACNALILPALEPNPALAKSVELVALSGFETFLLGDVSSTVFQQLSGLLVKPSVALDKTVPAVHLVWSLTVDDELGQEPVEPYAYGRLIVTVPLNAVRAMVPESLAIKPLPRNAPRNAQLLTDDMLGHLHHPVVLRLGHTQVRMSDLQLLEAGDIVILEASRAGYLFLQNRSKPADRSDEPPVAFKVRSATLTHMMEAAGKDEALKHLSAPTDQSRKDPFTMEQKPVWDNLVLDLKAEFEPVKMRLHDIKQISQGLVVEVGDLVKNRVRLHVDGKTLAVGELMIVGDQYAVRVTEVESPEKPLWEEEPPVLNAALSATGEAQKSAESAKAAPENAEDLNEEDSTDALDSEEEEDDW